MIAAYEHCRHVTRRNASNFYYGIRLLPRARREALFAVYALARRIDDVADGDFSDEAKLEALADIRRALERVDSSWENDPVMAALADASRRFPIPLEAFGDLIDGAEMDVCGTAYDTFEQLVVYCRRVGGSIGRLALGVFEARGDDAPRRADNLGVALQLTNILRDIREDLARGRVYIPREDLERFGVALGPGGPSGPVGELVRFEARRADDWFDDGLRLLPLLDRPSATCVAAMAGIYRRLLSRIERDPELVLRGRLSLPAWEKGWVAARSLVGAAS